MYKEINAKNVDITNLIFQIIDEMNESDFLESDLTVGNKLYQIQMNIEISDSRKWEFDKASGQHHLRSGYKSCSISNFELSEDGEVIRNDEWLVIDTNLINKKL